MLEINFYQPIVTGHKKLFLNALKDFLKTLLKSLPLVYFILIFFSVPSLKLNEETTINILLKAPLKE